MAPPAEAAQLVYERILPSVTSSIACMRSGLGEALGRVGLTQRRDDVVLVAHEAVSNVVLHAYRGTDPPAGRARPSSTGGPYCLALSLAEGPTPPREWHRASPRPRSARGPARRRAWRSCPARRRRSA